MKLAFVDSLPVGGGLSRFSLLLCKNLIENNAIQSIDYFIHFQNLKHIPEIQNIPGVDVFVLESTVPPGISKRIARRLGGRLFKNWRSPDVVIKEIEQCLKRKNYDLAYFPSAHMMKRPKLNIPVVGTIHDFNWRYFFGTQVFSESFIKTMDAEILNWIDKGHNICSSEDVVHEMKVLYPQAQNSPEVIPIAPVIFDAMINVRRADEIMRELEIDFPYLIFPGNFYPHKNHLNLFTAFSMLKKRKGFEQYKLILTGMYSDHIKRGIATTRGIRISTKNNHADSYDVIGMGYQSNEVVDVLISRARLLVSPSIYEAICTPGMDAWSFGTPTAISDIPPFREHEQRWGIKSAFFDPMDPKNIADVLENYLNNYDKAKDDGITSQKNMKQYTWKHVADEYISVFKKAISVK